MSIQISHPIDIAPEVPAARTHPTPRSAARGTSEFTAQARRHFGGGLGALGWLALVMATAGQWDGFRSVELSGAFWFSAVFAALARASAIKVRDRVRVALDSTLYLSGCFVYGVVGAAWVAGAVITADYLSRLIIQRLRGDADDRTSFRTLLAAIHRSGLPVGCLLVAGWFLGIDRRSTTHDGDLGGLVVALSLAFLSLHYAMSAVSFAERSELRHALIKGYAIRGFVIETLLVPLTLAMVLGYRHQGLGMYVLLGGTSLLFNAVFRRASLNGDELSRRIEELSTLNKVSRTIAGTLDRRILVQDLAKETVQLMGSPAHFMLGTLDRDAGMLDFELFDQRGQPLRSGTLSARDGLVGKVITSRRPQFFERVGHQLRDQGVPGPLLESKYPSWLVIPLTLYDEVVGLMAVLSEENDAFEIDQLRVLNTIGDQAVIALENARLYQLATVDGLTGLLVRRYFEQRLREEWARAVRYESGFSFGIIDIDNFKVLNDTYGHQVGDRALRAAASIILQSMRSADLAGRYGGEEFAFVLPRANIEAATKLSERIRNNIQNALLDPEHPYLRLTVSIGLAAFPDSGARSVTDLVAKADAALYRAKRLGKNRVVSAGADAASETLQSQAVPDSDA